MKVLAIALIAVGGFLIGGVMSLWRNDSRIGAGICGLLALMAIGGGVLWLVSS